MKNSVPERLLAQIRQVAKQIELPAIHSFTVAPPASPDVRRNNFAYLQLSDGSVGLTYVALDSALEDLALELPELKLYKQSACELAEHYLSAQGWERALGLAAINAISQHVLSRNKQPMDMPANLQLINARPNERVGMVGYFGRLVEPLRNEGIELTVIELDEQLLRSEPGLEVTLDAARLQGCAQVIITGTTLLNHSLDTLLPYCSDARDVFLLGPSASCLPDVLFDAGVTRVGGFRVCTPDQFHERWVTGGRWRDAGHRTLLTRENYPGLAGLLA